MSKTELFRPRRFENSEDSETIVTSTASPEQEEAAEDAPFLSSSGELPDEAEPLDRVLANLFELDALPEAPSRPASTPNLTDHHAFDRVVANLADSDVFREPPQKRLRTKTVGISVAIVASIVAGLLLFLVQSRRPAVESALAVAPRATAEGTAIVNSRPDGALVIIDGEQRGVTPLRVALKTGDHALEILKGSSSRTLSLSIEPGVVSSQYIELPVAPGPSARAPAAVRAAAGKTGALEITSEPNGASVVIDGQKRGTTPLLLKSVNAGRHDITISQGVITVRRSVVVSSGTNAVVDVSLAGGNTAAGWIALSAPFEVRVVEDGRVMASAGDGDTVMLLAGHHNLELSNDALEFRTTVDVQVSPGETVTVPVTLPSGNVSVNALPWAEVLVDGRAAGTTPLANLALSVGRHEIVFRHPQFGERRQSINVTARTPVRVGVDLTR